MSAWGQVPKNQMGRSPGNGSGTYASRTAKNSAVWEIFRRGKGMFRVVFTEHSKDIWNRSKCDVVCMKKRHGAPSLVAPKYDASDVFDCGLASPGVNARHDKFGSGVYTVGNVEFLLLGRDPYLVDFPPNVFLTVCAIRDGNVVETGDFQVNMLGEIVLVNRFEGLLPNGVVIDEHNILEVSEQRSWNMCRRTGFLTMKIPSTQFRKIYDNSILVPGERNKIRISMVRDISSPLVLTGEDENHIANERVILEKKLETALLMRR